MPQSYYTLGESLGKAAGGLFSDGAYNKGVHDGESILARRAQADASRAQAEKHLADAATQRRQNELQSDENLLGSALESAGLKPNQRAMFDTYRQTGGIGDGVFQKPNIFQKPDINLESSSSQKPFVVGLPEAPSLDSFAESLMQHTTPKESRLPLVVPDEFKGRAETALQVVSKLKQALALGDKNVENATKAAILQQVSSGDGTIGNLLAGLLDKGKTRFDGQTTGVTDVLTGDQVLNEIGSSQIVENNAQAGNANASAEKHKFDIANPKKAPSDEFKSVRDDIRSDFNAMYPISSINGKRPKDAPDFNAFTRDWLKQYNIPEQDFFNGGNTVAAPKADPNPEARFASDPAMKGNKAGKMIQGKGIEVFNASGKLIGHYK